VERGGEKKSQKKKFPVPASSPRKKRGERSPVRFQKACQEDSRREGGGESESSLRSDGGRKKSSGVSNQFRPKEKSRQERKKKFSWWSETFSDVRKATVQTEGGKEGLPFPVGKNHTQSRSLGGGGEGGLRIQNGFRKKKKGREKTVVRAGKLLEWGGDWTNTNTEE